MTSPSDFPFGSKSLPHLPHPIGSQVRAFLNTCSNPKNFKMLRFTDGWNLNPPLYGQIAELNCTLYPLLTCTFPASSVQATRNIMIRSGSTILSRSAWVVYFWFFSRKVASDSMTSVTAWWNSGSWGCADCMLFMSVLVMNGVITKKVNCFSTIKTLCTYARDSDCKYNHLIIYWVVRSYLVV